VTEAAASLAATQDVTTVDAARTRAGVVAGNFSSSQQQ
jgi:hypothetical protein